MNISAIRKEYCLKSLEINEVKPHPIDQFKTWFDEAINAEVLEANAMNLSTMGLDGFPNGRIVLLKGVDEGFVFYTNYKSQKGKELDHLNRASLTFFWPELERQVRIKGKVEKVSSVESDEYFFSRPYGSQIGAWTSPQSEQIASREELNLRRIEIENHFLETPIQRPTDWGGYRLFPTRMEFWQGRPGRLHDRIYYTLHEDSAWNIGRLAP